MIHKTIAALCGALLAASLASAQAPRFHWQRGQVLLYRSEHQTLASYTMGDNKSETKTHVQSVKRWQVLDVDASGTATLQMSLQALTFQTVRPDGETLSFDSTHPEKSTEGLRKQFANYVGKPLVVLRVDGRGKVVEVKNATVGHSAARYESDPPFKLLLPTQALRKGETWERTYQIVLEPPQGTGDEKYAAVQHYVCKDVVGNLATLTLTTDVKGAPAAGEDQVPLWQVQPQGEIVFDAQAGRLQKVTLKIDKQAKLDGGATHFQSLYTEQYAGDR